MVAVQDNSPLVSRSASDVNAQVDAVFVLSVKSFHERIAHVERELQRHGIEFEWIFEHDADELTPELIDSTFAPSDMGLPQQSLVLKHIETWKRCVARGYRRVLVFEDDVMLAGDFVQRFAAAMQEAKSIEHPFMLYLGCGDNRYAQPAPRADSVLVPTQTPLPAADAIVFDQRAARLRLDYIQRNRITRPADWLMRETDAAMGIAHYWLAEPIVEQGSMNGRFASVLDRKRIGRGRAWAWLRFRWDRWRRRPVLHFDPIRVAPATEQREKWAILPARIAAALVAIGTFTGPALANIAAGLMLLGLLAAPSCLQRVQRAWRQPLGSASLFFLAVLLAATLWSTVPFTTAIATWTEWRNFLLLFIALAIFDSRAAKLNFARLFVVAAATSAVASFFAFDFGAAQVTSDVKGGIVLRNHVTQGMALTIGALLSIMLAARARRGSWQQLGWAAATALMVVNVILVAYGRSGYVVLAIASIFATLGLWRGRARGVALVGLIVLGFAAMQLSPMINQRFEQGVQEIKQTDSASQLTSMGIRMVMWDTTAAIVRDAPLIGHGLASYPEQYRQRIERRYSDWKGTLSEDPHNQYLFILAETGLLGLAAFTWFLLCALRQPVRGPFRVIGFAALVAWCVTSLFSSHFHTFNEGHLIAIFLGVCLAREADSQARSAPSTADRTSA